MPVELTWQGPEACPGADATLAEIRAMLGNRVPADKATRVTVFVIAQQMDTNRWSLQVTTTSGRFSGERSLQVESCDEARRAVALLVALMIDPDAHGGAMGSGDAQTTHPQQPVAPAPLRALPTQNLPTQKPPPSDPSVVVAAAPASTQHGFVGLGLGVDHGTLPAVDFGLSLGLGIRARRWSTAARLSGWSPKSEPSHYLSGAGAKFGLYDAELAGCGAFLLGLSRSSVQVCAGPRAYLTHSSSYGISNPGSATNISWGLFAESAFRVVLREGLALRLALQGLIPLQRPQFAIRDLGFIYQQNPFAQRVTLGTEFDLW